MGSVGGLLGLGGGAAGSGFGGPQMAPITNPVTAAQLATANTGVQNSLTGQNALLTALQGQNGLQNQSNVYNQMQGVANGTGPNPAQAMLAQQTGQNVANQSALMAGQRGAGANVGLMARQAGQQGGALQQNAIGQGASMQAQQSLNALGQMGGLANTQAANQIGQTNAVNNAQQAQQNALLNAQQGYNTNVTQSQGNVNQGNVNLANTTMGGQQAGIGGLMNSFGGASGMLGSISNLFGGGGEDVDSELNAMSNEGMFAGGGRVKKYADGGDAFSGGPSSEFGQFLSQQPVPQQAQNTDMSQSNGGYNKPSGKSGGGLPMPSMQSLETAGNAVGNALSDTGSWLGDAVSGIGGWLGDVGAGLGTMAGGAADAVGVGATDAAPALAAAKGGQVPALVSPGEIYLSPKAVQQVRAGADPMKVGERIGGKPKVGGAKNSYANDTVKKTLQEGGIVVPRSETKSKNPERNSKAFVDATLAKRKVRK